MRQFFTAEELKTVPCVISRFRRGLSISGILHSVDFT